jgi:hypothetical protein
MAASNHSLPCASFVMPTLTTLLTSLLLLPPTFHSSNPARLPFLTTCRPQKLHVASTTTSSHPTLHASTSVTMVVRHTGGHLDGAWPQLQKVSGREGSGATYHRNLGSFCTESYGMLATPRFLHQYLHYTKCLCIVESCTWGLYLLQKYRHFFLKIS